MRPLLLAAALGAGAALAAGEAPAGAREWPDTPASRVFRQRVIDLAVLYGDSSGVDEDGFLIRATLRGAATPPCKSVDVEIELAGTVVRRDRLQVCK